MNNLRTSPLSSCKNLPPYFFMVHLLHRLYGVDAPVQFYRASAAQSHAICHDNKSPISSDPPDISVGFSSVATEGRGGHVPFHNPSPAAPWELPKSQWKKIAGRVGEYVIILAKLITLKYVF